MIKNKSRTEGFRQSWQALQLIKPFLRKYGLRIFWGFLALLGVDFLQLVVPRFIKKAVDQLHALNATGETLMSAAGFILLFAAVIAVCRFFWRYLIIGFSRLLERDLRNRFLTHLLALDRSFFQKNPAGHVMALATNDLAAVQLAAGMGLVASLDAVVMSAAAVGFMVYISPSLTLIAVVPMPFLILVTRFLSARLHNRFLKVQEQFSRLTEFSRAAIGSIRLLKAFNQEKSHAERFGEVGLAYVHDNLRLATVQGALFPVSSLIANISLLLVFFFGGKLVVGKVITVGDFVAFMSYLFMLTWPMMAIGWVAHLFQRGVTSLSRLKGIFDSRTSFALQSACEEFKYFKGNIIINDLEFTYPGQKEAALRGVNLAIEGGKMLGIVGPTGSGKSTLCHLLARLYPVADGKIFFDGKDINSLETNAIWESIAYVPQDVVLFSDTVAGNIALGKPEANQGQIEAAAKMCAIHEEILCLPDGYHTRIGEKGIRLSGGQRQRITLARALLLDRPFLIIDDGLSAVDAETESRITQNLRAHLKGKTCIIVSHRVAPLASAAKIAVFDEGRCAAQGSHAELLRANNFYAAIYHRQVLTKGKEEVR